MAIFQILAHLSTSGTRDGKIFPIINTLMTGISSLENVMENNIKNVLVDARKQTQNELRLAKNWDKNHKLANSKIFRNLKKTTNWLKSNDIAIVILKIFNLVNNLNKTLPFF